MKATKGREICNYSRFTFAHEDDVKINNCGLVEIKPR